ncbi:RNI-like protein [Fistulina hepatica ATCC 64428]|nr:RNI-like protein [Fistulina hepatica ATCC 64428]
MLPSNSARPERQSRIDDRLPTQEEWPDVRHLVLKDVEVVILSGVTDLSDRTLIAIARQCYNIGGLGVSGCTLITDFSLLELATVHPPLRWLHLTGAVGTTDPAVSAIARSCADLVELELADLPLVTAISLREVWDFSRNLQSLNLSRLPQLDEKAFPSAIGPDDGSDSETARGESADDEKPLPHRPVTVVEALPPLILTRQSPHLRILDLSYCPVTDDVIAGIVYHAPKIQNLILAGCTRLTDHALEHVARLGPHLDILVLAHVSSISDVGMMKIARACTSLRCVDLAFCRNLTDLTILELANLQIQRLSVVRVQRLTDMAIYALAEHTRTLERLHMSYCDNITLNAVHFLLKKCPNLIHLSATGVPSFRRKGVRRFSGSPPSGQNHDPAAFRVFDGENVGRLLWFLNKEEKRKREAEAQNVVFKARGDDKMDLDCDTDYR